MLLNTDSLDNAAERYENNPRDSKAQVEYIATAAEYYLDFMISREEFDEIVDTIFNANRR